MMKRIWGVIGIFGILALGWANLGFCGTVTVSGTTTVFTTIQAGVNACPVGGTVSVAAGTYTEAVYINKRIALVGNGTPTITTVGLGNTTIPVTFNGTETDRAFISGFRITGGTYIYGGGIYCNQASPTITNNTISGNSTGIYCYSSSPTITNNTISGNCEGIFCYSSSSPTITNNTISGNECHGILCKNYSSPTITNNTISGNCGGISCEDYSSSTITNNMISGNEYHGIVCWNYSSPTITNNTISGNGMNGIHCYDSSPTITNNIITENGTTTINGSGIYYDSYDNPQIDYNIDYNNVWGNGLNGNNNYYRCFPGAHDISANPGFIASVDFHLGTNSPCINAGSNTALKIPTTDKDGNPRIVNGIADMGAYEYQGTIALTTGFFTITSIPIGAKIYLDGADTGEVTIHTFTNISPGTHTIKLTLSSCEDWSGTVMVSARLITYVYVTLLAYGNEVTVYPGGATYTTIQKGVNACPTGGTVSVPAGTYNEAVHINKRIAIIGVGTPTITSKCLAITNTVIFDGTVTNGASISGFIITGAPCPWWASNQGNGIYCKNGSPIITNNTIYENGGSGINYDDSSPSPTITNNTISGNGGSGIRCYHSSPTITNNTISGNELYGISCDSSDSSPTITNNTISGNGGSGICAYSFSSTITNNIITENGAGANIDNGYGIHYVNPGGTQIINYNNVWGNGVSGNKNYCYCSAGANAISVNPQFVAPGDFHLGATSPCIDAGSNTAMGISSTDKDGNPRIVRTVDMGAYEYQGIPTPAYIVVTPNIGTVGTMITVAGNNFGPGELIRISFGTTRTITMVSTIDSSWTTVFTADTQPMGTTTITAYRLSTGVQMYAYFVIVPSTILKLTPSSQNVALGSTFTCQVEIKDVQQLIIAETYLSFNPDVLEVLEVNPGAFPSGGSILKNNYDNIKGQINYSVGIYPAPASATGSGILYTIKFRAKAGGATSVAFDSDTLHNRNTLLINANNQGIPFIKQEAIYQVITGLEVNPKEAETRIDKTIVYTCLVLCGSSTLDVTGSTTFTANGGGSFTTNTFMAKYIGMYTIQGAYFGIVGTTSIIIYPGTPTTLSSVSGSDQTGTCAYSLKDPFIIKVADTYGNPCSGVEVSWQIISSPSGASGQFVSSTKTTTNIQGTASSLLTLGTAPPGVYVIHAISTGLSGSPCIFTAQSLRQFGNITGFCLLDSGTETLGTSSDITVEIVELGTTATTNDDSYFMFQNVPAGTYTLTFNTWGASSASKSNICISSTQIENTTYMGTITLLAGDLNNDGQVNINDWGGFIDAFGDYEGNSEGNWQQNKKGDFNHDGQVNGWDFAIFWDNFNRSQPVTNMRSLSPILANAKAKETTSGELQLSFNLETIEGVNVDDLRIGNIIYLKICIRNARNYLGGEVHLSFNPDVLQIVDANKDMNGIQIQTGNFPCGSLQQPPVYLKNRVDNLTGKIDYAVAVWKPEEDDEGLLAIVPFKVISCGATSKVGFDFNAEENRETMFVERTGKGQFTDRQPSILAPEEVIVNVPLVFNNLNSALVYPNPACKGDIVRFGNLPNSKQIMLKVFNIAGELVLEKEEKSNNNTIQWDLRNKNNEYVSTGIYIYLLEYEGSTKQGKIGVIK